MIFDPLPEEIDLEDVIRKMTAASNAFYRAASATGNHAFIEWTGLMNEYIQICERARQMGINFTRVSKHSGKSLPIKDHELNYLAEKLECIFNGDLEIRRKRA